MLKVGLTGGIGSGKTTVANLFAELGVPIIDTDIIAREIVEPHTAAWEAIRTYFGEHIIDPVSLQLNRHQLRQIVFTQPAEKKWLENILHPLIRQQVKERIAALSAPYCIVVIPLLFETDYDYALDRVLVVNAQPEQQISRIMQRDRISREEAKHILTQQVSQAYRLAHANDIIDNTNENLDLLKTQVVTLHQRYLQLAHVEY